MHINQNRLATDDGDEIFPGFCDRIMHVILTEGGWPVLHLVMWRLLGIDKAVLACNYTCFPYHFTKRLYLVDWDNVVILIKHGSSHWLHQNQR